MSLALMHRERTARIKSAINRVAREGRRELPCAAHKQSVKAKIHRSAKAQIAMGIRARRGAAQIPVRHACFIYDIAICVKTLYTLHINRSGVRIRISLYGFEYELP